MSGGAISWLSQKLSVVALSTTEAEYVALCGATQEAIWLRRLLSNIQSTATTAIVINEDNQGTIAVAKNSFSHKDQTH